MTHTRKKLTVAGAGLLLAIAFLAFAGAQGGWVYHVPVDEFAQDAQHKIQRVRVAGKVAEDGLEVNGGRLTARFVLAGKTVRLPVLYHGVIPDLFKAGAEVVVEGKLDQAGVFQADVLMTKLARKYESEEHAQRVKELS